jgi:hypothetical protein
VTLRTILLALGVLLLVGSACSFGSREAPVAEAPEASPTLLPPPRSSSSPEPDIVASPSPSAAVAAAASPTPIAPPNPAVAAKPAAPAEEHVKVANTGGDGANMRAEPATTGALVKTVAEGTDLLVIGPDRDAGGRHWRNVRDPASNASGWIVTDLLAAVETPPEAAAAASGPAPAPAGALPPAPSPGAAAPPAAPPSGSSGVSLPPAASPVASANGQAVAAPKLSDADRTYLSTLQPQVDALGKSISAANEQIERAGGKPDIASDPTWRQDTQTAAASLTDAATKIRAMTPGPNTADVQKYAMSGADHASAAAASLNTTLQSNDTRTLNGVRTELVRVLADINNMNLTLLNLQ